MCCLCNWTRIGDSFHYLSCRSSCSFAPQLVRVLLNSIFITRGKDVGKSFTVTNSKTTIGRGRESTIRLTDEEVSRLHCSVEIVSSVAYLADEGSVNGTFLNGEKVTRAPISKGDSIRIGKTEFVFDSFLQISIDPNDAAPKTAAPTRFRAASRKTDANSGSESNGISLKLDKDDDSTYQKLANSKGEVEAGKQFVQLKNDLNFVYRASLATSRALDTAKMFQELILLIFEWVEADRGCVLLKDEATGEFEVRHLKVREGSSCDTEQDATNLKIQRSVIDYVIEHRVGVLSPANEYEIPTDAGSSALSTSISEVVCVPIEGRNREFFGVLYLDRLSEIPSTNVSRFNMDHLRLMLAMANQTATAIENEVYYRALIEQERLAAIGEITSLMSHRINNILQGLGGGSHLLEAGLDKDDLELCQTGWDITHKNQDQLAQLVKDLVVLSKPFDPHNSECRLSDIVNSTILAMEPELNHLDVKCQFNESHDHDFTMHLDPNYIKSALMNLVRVAAQSTASAKSNSPVDVSLKKKFDSVEVIIRYEGKPIGISSSSIEQETVRMGEAAKQSSADKIQFGKFELAVAEKILKGYSCELGFEEIPKGGQFTVRLSIA